MSDHKYWFATYQHNYIAGGSPTTFHMIIEHHPLLELEDQMRRDREKENRYQSDIALLFYKKIERDEEGELRDIIKNSAEDNCGEFYVRDDDDE
jgi:hypothetical protein